MRRITNYIFIVFSCLFFLLTSCTNKEVEKVAKDKISIVTTIFPIYDITKELCDGVDAINVTLLMDSGIDLHNYSPTSKDLIGISESDLFIYIGGESDEWVDSAFDSLNIDKEKQINLMEELATKIKEEEQKEGMEEEEGESEEEGVEYDEHIWLSLRNAKEISKVIYERINRVVDTENGQKISGNYARLTNMIDNLDSKYCTLVDNAKVDMKCTTLLFADRFPFRYMIDDYGLDYYAAFKGCSAESEASFKTVKFLADKINELNLSYIFVIDDSDKKIAKTVIETAGKDDVSILTLDSMQSKTAKDVESGVRYIDVMEKNYSVLEEYLK